MEWSSIMLSKHVGRIKYLGGLLVKSDMNRSGVSLLELDGVAFNVLVL